MKSFFVLSLILVISIVFVGCEQGNDIVSISDFETTNNITADSVHSEFLKELYANEDVAQLEKSAHTKTATTVANDLLIRYGETPMTEEQVSEAIEHGRQMAKMDPDVLIASVLNPTSLVWWYRFADEATAQNCRQVYTDHCEEYGTPIHGSALETMTGIAMSSGEFWSEYRKNDTPHYQNPYVPQQNEKSWRGFFRFIVAVAVDGGSGALVSAGGPVASGVVGGLASTGADYIIFGDD